MDLLLAAFVLMSTPALAQPTAFARPELLVDTAWLAANLTAPNVRIVDLRPRGYADGHIPGAVWLDNNDIRNPAGAADLPADAAGIRGADGPSRASPTPRGSSPTTSAAASTRRGSGGSSTTMATPTSRCSTAAGPSGRPTSVATDAVVPAPAAARFTVKKGTVGVATAADVKAAINNPKVKLIDGRSQGEIDGKDLRGIKRGGYIESSIPVYWEDTLNAADRTFKSPAEIEALWRGKGVGKADAVTVYCQIGMRASHDLFTLALLGHDLTKLRNYYGAWEEWGNRDDTPIKTKN